MRPDPDNEAHANDSRWCADLSGLPVAQIRYGPVEGLPELAKMPPDALYIVSAAVFRALQISNDPRLAQCATPDTSDAVRDARGRITAVRRLIIA